MTKRGFTLIEIMLAITISLFMITLGVTRMRTGLGSADSHSLALTVSEQLRLARQTAIASQEPVAVALPSNGGSTSVSQSLYTATGASMAHVSQILSFAGSNPESVLFAGIWPLAGGSFTVNPMLPGQRVPNLSQWLTNPNIGYNLNKDFAIVFQPDGSVVTNGLPYYQGAYSLVACAGISSSASSAPSGPSSSLSYFKVNQAGRPWTIAVTPSGEVSLSAGLPGQDGSVLMVATQGLPSGLGAPPPVSQLAPPNVQVAVPGGVTIYPSASGTTGLPTGVNATMVAGQRLSLAVNATDTSGQDLYVSWNAQPAASNQASTAPAAGNFSMAGPARMTWDPTHQSWTSSLDWLCPTNAGVNDTWTFTPSFGPSPTAMVMSSGSAQELMAVQQAHIWGWVSPPGTTIDGSPGLIPGTYVVYRSNLDGTGQVAVSSVQTNFQASADMRVSGSIDGQTFCVVTGSGVELFSSSGGPPIQETLTGMGSWSSSVKLSPKGDYVAYAMDSPARLVVQPVGGGPGTVIYQDGVGSQLSFGAAAGGATWIPQVCWSPDESKLSIYTGTPTGGSMAGTIWTMSPTGTNRQMVINITSPTTGMEEQTPHMAWDSAGRFLLMTRADIDSEGWRWDSQTNTYDSSAYTNTGGALTWSSSIQYSPDNSQILWEDVAGYNMYTTPNTPQSGYTRVPFNVLGGSVVSFAVTK